MPYFIPITWWICALLGACQENQPLQKQTQTQTLENRDTTKIVFQTIPLEPLKTDIADLKTRLEAGTPTKIVCYGNSITYGYKVETAGKVASPYPETLAQKLQLAYPKARLTVKNEGHSGWRADQALQMVGKLVLPEKPDWVILELGINDAYSGFLPLTYTNYMHQIVQILKQNNIKVLLMTATPIATPFHAKVLAYHAPLRAMAQAEQTAFLDLSTYIAKRAEKEKLTAKALLPDDVHFFDEGYAWIAEAIVSFL